MELDLIYKTGVGESHEAGLQAVFNEGVKAGVEAYHAAAQDPAPEAPAPEAPPAEVPVSGL